MKNELKSPMQEFEEIVFPLIQLSAMQAINWGGLMRAKLSFDSYYNVMAQQLISKISTVIISNKVHEREVLWYKYPRTWIEAFKKKHWKYFPRPLKRRFPIQYKSVPTKIEHVHVCPHTNDIPWDKHMTFMRYYDQESHSSASKANEKCIK